MKSLVIRSVLTIGVLAFIIFSVAPLAVSAEEDDMRLITVTGDAEVRVTPDEVIITLGVETSDKNIDKAKQQNDERVQKVMSLTESYGIESKHVQTEYINIEPRYEYEYEQRNFLGYFVQKTIVVTLRDISKFEDFLTDVLKAGVNYVHGIEFRTTELRKHKDHARSLAIQAAREKAEALAGELGQSIGLPQSISENQSWWWSSYSSWWGGHGRSMMAQNVIQDVGGAAPGGDGTFAPGQIVVKATISVSFEMKELEQ